MKKIFEITRALFYLGIIVVFIACSDSFRNWQKKDIKQVEDIDHNIDIKKNIEVALSELDEDDIKLSSTNHQLEIIPINFSLSEKRINSMLAKADKKSGILIYSWRNAGKYTMSAQAVDQSRHLVNTFLEGYQPFKVENVMMPLYILAQRKSYLLDSKQYQGRADVWQSSRQAFLYPRGDCEDHAIVLADWLIEMGQDARVVVGDMDGAGHAWVVLLKGGKEYLLEATKKYGLGRNKPYPLAVLHKGYHPRYMFNREGFWVNNDTKYTTDYSGKHWEKKSHYSQSKISNGSISEV